jgi:IS1 family transposase
VESWNSKLRDNLAKLNRDTKRFPKSIKALEDSIYLLANREFVVGIIF